MRINWNIWENRPAKFYVAFGIAALSVLTAVIYAAAFAGLDGTISWGAFVLLLISGFGFYLCAAFGFERTGIAFVGICDFVALLLSAAAIYGYFMDFAMTGLSEAGAAFPMYIVCAGLMLACAIAANELAWMRLRKKPVAEKRAD